MTKFRLWVFLTAFILSAGGAYLVHYSGTLPEWTDAAKAYEIRGADPPDRNKSESERRAYVDDWYRQMDEVRTLKWPLYDFGLGLVALMSTVAASVFLLRIRSVSDFRKLSTPRSRLIILGVCTLAWILQFYAANHALQQDFQRQMFPSWGDNIGIGMAGLILFYFFGLLLLIPISWFAALHRAALPINLWIWRKDAPIASWFFTLCATISIYFGLEALIGALRFGPYQTVPAAGLWIYGTLCVRAAGISSFASRSRQTA